MGRHVDGRAPLDVARQRPRCRVLGPLRIDTHGLRVDDAVAAARVADDVIVEVGIDDHRLVGGDARRMGVRADQPLFFARPQREDQRGVELEAALGQHPRQFHRQRRAAAVVIGA